MQTNQPNQQELLALETQYWQAIKDRDAQTAMKLSDDPCILTGAQGFGSFTPEQLAAMMPEARYELRDFQIDPGAEVKLISPDVAVVAYKVHEDLIVEGEPLSLDAAESSTWVKRGSQWRCALHTEALLGDPFGRDRVFESVF